MLKPVATPDNTDFVEVPYSFTYPYQAYVKSNIGVVTFTGFGIGEIVKIMEPAMQYLITRSEILNDLPLSDGSFILDCPDLELKQVWPNKGEK